MKNEVLDLMFKLATQAMIMGKDFSIEKRDYSHEAKGIAGLGAGHTEDTSVILKVWQLSQDEESFEDLDDLDDLEEDDACEEAAEHDVTEFELTAPVIEAGGSTDGE